MAGGEFRLGTDSIYMALTCHIRCLTAIYKSHITWLRFPSQFPGTPSNSTPYRFSKKEVRSKSSCPGAPYQGCVTRRDAEHPARTKRGALIKPRRASQTAPF